MESSSSIEIVPLERASRVGPEASVVAGPGSSRAELPSVRRLTEAVRRDRRSVERLLDMVRSASSEARASRRHGLRIAGARVERIRRRLRALAAVGVDVSQDRRWLDVKDAELSGLSDNLAGKLQ